MTPSDIGIAIATNFFTGCTQQLLDQIDQKAAATRVDSDAWKERSKSLEQRITQQLNLAARSINYPKENLDRLAAILSDQVFVSDTVNAFLDGRLQATKFAEEIASRDPNFKGDLAISAIAQALLDTFTAAIAADPELSRVVNLKRFEGVKQHLAKIDTQLEEHRALLTQIAERTVVVGKPGEQLTSQERHERALLEVAAMHALTVPQLRKAIVDFVARIRADSAASDFDRALALFVEQDYAGAEVKAERAVQTADRQLERAIDAKRKALLLLGDAQHAQLKYSAAEETYRVACDLAEQQDPLFLADASWRLCIVLSELGHYEEAVRISKRTLEIAEELFDDAGVSVALNHLGLALQHAGRPSDAEPILRRAVQLWESKTQEEDLVLATHLNNLASLLREQGRAGEAEPLIRKALTIRERLLGKDHPDVATCVTNIAFLLEEEGKLEEAETLFRRAYLTCRSVLPPDHRYCVTTASNLGMILKERGRVDEAEPLLREVVNANERVFGTEHPHFAESLNNLGLAQLAKRSSEQAECTFRRAFEIQKKCYGAEHPKAQVTANNLGIALLAQKKYAAAEEIFRESLSIKQKVLHADHPSLANTLNNLGFVSYLQRRLDAAENFYRRALAIREKSLHENNPELGNSLGNLGLVLNATRRHDEAESMFVRELKIRRHEIPPNHESIAQSISNIALSQYHQGKINEAKKALGTMIEYCDSKLGIEHVLSKEARRNLAKIDTSTEN